MRTLALALVAVLVTACDRDPKTPPDPYADLELKSPPAKVTAERNKGAFAEGAALSTGAELKPLDPAPVKTVRLDTTHKIIEIMPGGKFTAWTFGDQVPKRRTEDWLARWLKSPEQMIATDPAAKALLQKYNNVPMPLFPLHRRRGEEMSSAGAAWRLLRVSQ